MRRPRRTASACTYCTSTPRASRRARQSTLPSAISRETAGWARTTTSRSDRLLCLDQSVTDRDQRELGLILDAELLLDVVQMRTDSRGRELEILGDALHGRAAGEAHEDIEFAFREPLDRRLALEFGEREFLCQGGIEIASAGGHAVDRLEQRVGRAALR